MVSSQLGTLGVPHRSVTSKSRVDLKQCPFAFCYYFPLCPCLFAAKMFGGYIRAELR